MIEILSAIDKVAFKIGTLEVRWYGIIIVFAMILGLIFLCVDGKRVNINADDAVELFLWIIPLAIIFARIVYIIVRPEEYFPWHSWQDFVDAIAIWDGGITIVGGILGGIIGALIFAYRKRKKASFGQIVDLAIPPLLLGQIIGRLGNFINQEAFGVYISDPKYQKFPFAVYIDDPNGGIEIEDYWHGEGWYAATFFYEMVWNAIGLGVCLAIWRKNKKYPGLLGFFYFFWYFLGRGWLEFLRIDAVPITKYMCFIFVPISLIAGILYIAARRSRLSFKKVNDAVEGNLLYITELDGYDIKNYKFAAKILSSSNNPLKILYGVKKFEPVEIESMHYLDAVKIKRKNRWGREKKQK